MANGCRNPTASYGVSGCSYTVYVRVPRKRRSIILSLGQQEVGIQRTQTICAKAPNSNSRYDVQLEPPVPSQYSGSLGHPQNGPCLGSLRRRSSKLSIIVATSVYAFNSRDREELYGNNGSNSRASSCQTLVRGMCKGASARYRYDKTINAIKRPTPARLSRLWYISH